jgi:hypothetical protein
MRCRPPAFAGAGFAGMTAKIEDFIELRHSLKSRDDESVFMG